MLVLALVLAGSVAAADPGAEELYRQAESNYAAARYAAASADLEQALREVPDTAAYFHLLGKCYGRMAEAAGGLKAIPLARKSKAAFERAVELDGENTAALRDLMEYYRQAPAFLGGSRTKADAIERRLARLETR